MQLDTYLVLSMPCGRNPLMIRIVFDQTAGFQEIPTHRHLVAGSRLLVDKAEQPDQGYPPDVVSIPLAAGVGGWASTGLLCGIKKATRWFTVPLLRVD